MEYLKWIYEDDIISSQQTYLYNTVDDENYILQQGKMFKYFSEILPYTISSLTPVNVEWLLNNFGESLYTRLATERFTDEELNIKTSGLGRICHQLIDKNNRWECIYPVYFFKNKQDAATFKLIYGN